MTQQDELPPHHRDLFRLLVLLLHLGQRPATGRAASLVLRKLVDDFLDGQLLLRSRTVTAARSL